MPEEVADGDEGDAAHHKPAGKRMPEIVEVEVGQARALAGPVKGVPNIVVASSCWIVKDPRYVWPSPQSAKERPQGFIERQRPCLSVLRLLQPDKPVHHIHGIPSEGQ
jgi:hypothetical protein